MGVRWQMAMMKSEPDKTDTFKKFGIAKHMITDGWTIDHGLGFDYDVINMMDAIFGHVFVYRTGTHRHSYYFIEKAWSSSGQYLKYRWLRSRRKWAPHSHIDSVQFANMRSVTNQQINGAERIFWDSKEDSVDTSELFRKILDVCPSEYYAEFEQEMNRDRMKRFKRRKTKSLTFMEELQAI